MDGEPVITPDEDGQPRTLRAGAPTRIDHQVKWIPPWGRDRIFNMVANRPDWCISRQRAWACRSRRSDCTSLRRGAVLTAAIVGARGDGVRPARRRRLA